MPHYVTLDTVFSSVIPHNLPRGLWVIRDVMSTQYHVSLPKGSWGYFENESHCLIQFSLRYHVTRKCVSQDLRWCLEQWQWFTGYVASQLLPLPWWVCNSCLVFMAVVQFAMPHHAGNPAATLCSREGLLQWIGWLQHGFSFVNDLCHGLRGQVHPSMSPSVCCSWCFMAPSGYK